MAKDNVYDTLFSLIVNNILLYFDCIQHDMKSILK